MISSLDPTSLMAMRGGFSWAKAMSLEKSGSEGRIRLSALPISVSVVVVVVVVLGTVVTILPLLLVDIYQIVDSMSFVPLSTVVSIPRTIIGWPSVRWLSQSE